MKFKSFVLVDGSVKRNIVDDGKFVFLLIFNDRKYFFKFSNLRSLEISSLPSLLYVFSLRLWYYSRWKLRKKWILCFHLPWIRQFTQSKHKICYLFLLGKALEALGYTWRWRWQKYLVWSDSFWLRSLNVNDGKLKKEKVHKLW